MSGTSSSMRGDTLSEPRTGSTGRTRSSCQGFCQPSLSNVLPRQGMLKMKSVILLSSIVSFPVRGRQTSTRNCENVTEL